MKTFIKKLHKAIYGIVILCALDSSLKAQAGSALNFLPGTFNYVNLSPAQSYWSLGNNFTMEMWINPSSTGNQILLYGGLGCSHCPTWALHIGPEVTCGYGGSAGKVVFSTIMGARVESDLSPALGVWSHIAVTYNGSVMKMYVNGLQQSLVTRFTGTVGAVSNMYMGADPGCSYRLPYNGSMDELRIWNTERTQCEIQKYMQCEIPTTAANLTANFHFNSGTAGANNGGVTTLVNSAGTGNGTLLNFNLNGSSSNWVTPGGVPNGNTTIAVATVSVNVSGNSTNIGDGDGTPSTTDHTDFNGALTRTFVIQNTIGGGTLDVAAYLTGPNANDFSITTVPSSAISGIGSTTMVITLLTGGVKSATVNITNNDCSASVYDFVISASATKYQAINFDGANDYILLPKNIGYDFTIEYWMRTTQTGNTGLQWNLGAGIVDADVIGTQSDFGTSLNGNKLAFGIGNPDVTIFSTSNVNTGQWVHVAVTRKDATGAINLYINGVLEASGTAAAGSRAAPSAIAIGSQLSLVNSFGYFNGDVDEVRIWNNVRTQCEIQTYMNCEILNPFINLVGNYHFNQGTSGSNASVTSLQDGSGWCIAGLFYNGTLNNFALTGTSSNWINPGAITTDFSTPASTLSIINITGNSSSILDNSSVPSTTNHTDFGSNGTRTFVIQNAGTGILYLNALTFTGPNSSEFSVVSLPSNTLNTSASGTIVIAFTPTASGVRNASINISSTDCSNSLFSFAIKGEAPPAEAIGLDGSNDYAGRAILTSNTTSVTLQAKVFWRGTTSQSQMIVYNGNSGANGYGIYNAVGSGAVQVLYGGIVFSPFNYTLTPNQWTSLAIVLRGGLAECYANGVLTNIITTIGTPGVPTGSFTAGGNIIGTENLNGIVDEVLVWDKALSQCEIQSYLNCEIPGSAPNLLANYHFNQGSPGLNNAGVINILDDSGNNNTMTLLFCSLTGTFENWVSPGGVVSGYTATSIPGASITLSGNSNPIANNTTTITTLNHTDFGSASSRTFVIQNSNTGTLNIGTPYLTGPNISEFSITVLPSPTLAASATTSFVVAFTPTAGGARSATINIYNNDCNAPIFNFKVEGSAPLASALNFDGSDDHIAVSGHTLNGQSFTIEFYAKRNSNSTQDFIFGQGTNSNNDGLHIGFYDFGIGNILVFGFWNDDVYINNTDLLLHHWACVYDATAAGHNRFLYLDGVLVSSNRTNIGYTGTGPAFIGTNPWGISADAFDGTIDELRIWNTARTQCEIQTYMKCEIPSTAPGLVSNYHFNQGSPNLDNSSVTLLNDAAGAHTGTLTGFALTSTISNWVSPGAVVSDYTITSPPSATITVSGNSNPVTHNSTTVSTTNHTDFGSVATRTFVITNSNTGTLNIGTPYLTGINASEFSVTVLPSSFTLAASATTSFVVAFTPTTGGPQSATININNNDCNIPIFNFKIEGHAPLASALDFNGSSNYVITPALSSSIGITNDITLEAWIKPNGSGVVINEFGAVLLPSWHLAVLEVVGSNVMAKIEPLPSINLGAITLGTWNHIVVRYNHALGRVEGLLNGKISPSISQGTRNSPLSFGSQQHYALGSADGNNNGSGAFYSGQIDEVRIWNTFRSDCEIQTYMNCEIPTTASGLVANYHFNQGSHGLNNIGINTLTDMAGANNATLVNFGLTGTSSNWVSPAQVANDFTTSISPTASISVTGNSNPVTNNSTTVSTTNHTDFGSVVTRIFVIQNSNTGTLNIGTPYLTGPNASEFSVTVLPSSPTLSASATTSFVVAFTPTAGGARSATVNINNNDCNIPIFNFKIEGTPPPAEALNFDGTDDYIDLPSSNLPTGNNDFTVEYWVKIKSAQTFHRWITWMGSVTAGSMVAFGYDGNNGNKIRIHHLGPDMMTTTASITPNVWTHVAMNYRGATFSNDIFINGNYVETLNFGVPLTLPAGGAFQIGTFNSLNTYCANVDLDEFRVWNRALCAAEIQNNMNCEIATTAPGLVANYHFNQGSQDVSNGTVTTLTDASGSINTGTLANFALTSTVSNWAAPGAVTSGSSCSIYLNPEINLMGNGINILDGNTTPSVTDNTDFGAICINTLVIRTFSIQNVGTGPLSISSIAMSGLDAALFTAGPLSPSSPIAAGSSAVFSVTFTPGTSGVKTATLNVNSTDCDENIYDVALTGTINALPVVSASTGNSVICNTFTTSLSGGGADTYVWTGGTITNGIAFSPTITATYTVAGTNTLTGCTSTNLAVQTITVNALPIVGVTTLSNSICLGNSTTLTATNADTYTWTPGPLTGATITPSPALTTTYAVIGTNTLTGCMSTNIAVQTITVNAIPTVTASTPNATVCAGVASTLIASGASTYTWNPGPVIGSTVNPIPAGTTTYSLAGTSTAGCISVNSATILITVNPLPTVSINAHSVVICSGASASLSASGANTYTWNPGVLTTTIITPSPLSNTAYTLTGTSLAGCASTNLAVQNVTVNALPSVTASASNSVICNSGTTSLIGSGADTYTWNPGNIPDATPFSPAATLSYTLSGTHTLTGCGSTNLAVQTISVNPSPTLGLTATNTIICAGDSPTLTASNANTYTWNPGNFTTTVISPALAATTVFTLTGSSPAGCLSANSPTQQITVNALPVVTASASSASVCAGFSTSLHGGGASTYLWTGGIMNAASFTPGTTSSYTVTGTDLNNCVSTASITLTVNPVPGVTANITFTAVCQGTSLTLSGSGADTYTWSGGINDGQAFVPAGSADYSLTGISLAGCSSTNAAVVSVSVNALPSVTASASNPVICSGNTLSLNGAGAISYSWTGGITDNAPFSPTVSMNYTVTGEDTNGCQNTATVDVTVNNLPVLAIAASNTLSCEAESTTLTVSGADTYTWNTSQNAASIVVTPTFTTTYSVTGLSLQGCVNQASYTQSVSPCLGTLTAVASVTDESCTGKGDGIVSITSTNSYSNSELSYTWSSPTLCPANDCPQVEGLNEGTLSVMVKVTYTLNNILVKQDSILVGPITILNMGGACNVKIYTAVSPNGDGLNDSWQIENITEFPKNKVTVYNRWGTKVFEINGYDNVSKAWPLSGESSNLQANTYFYLIDLGNGSKPIKGWVELIKN